MKETFMNLIKCLILLRSFIMSTKQTVLDAVAAAATRINENTTLLLNKITALKIELSNGTPITSVDLDEILTAVNALAAAPVIVNTLPTTAP